MGRNWSAGAKVPVPNHESWAFVWLALTPAAKDLRPQCPEVNIGSAP